MLYPLSYGGSARDYRLTPSAVPELGECSGPDRIGPVQAVTPQRVDGRFLQALGFDR